jgi:hypothetical protein
VGQSSTHLQSYNRATKGVLQEDLVHLKPLSTFCLALCFSWGSISGAQRASEDVKWISYTDPAEASFSMDVPYGWQIQGGMYRFGYFDVRWMMNIRSLDGKVILRIDDANVPPYAIPGPSTGTVGQTYFRPQQFQMLIEDYHEAQSYAAAYAKHRFSSVCKTLTPRQVDWTPTMPQAWRGHAADSNKVTEATLSYACTTSDGARIVTVFARSTLHTGSHYANWIVDPLISVITAPDRATLAHSMVEHMIGTWQENPKWTEYQSQMVQQGLNQIRGNFNQFMQQMQAYHRTREAAMNQQVARYQSEQNNQAQQVSNWGQTLTGLTKLSDPNTGTQFQAFTGPKSNYYTNGNGVNINSDVSPGPGFHQVNQVPQ